MALPSQALGSFAFYVQDDREAPVVRLGDSIHEFLPFHERCSTRDSITQKVQALTSNSFNAAKHQDVEHVAPACNKCTIL